MHLDSRYSRIQVVASLSYRGRVDVGAAHRTFGYAQFKYYEMYKRGKLDGVRSRKRRAP